MAETMKTAEEDKAFLTEGAEDPVDHEDFPRRVRIGRYRRYEFGGHRNMAPGMIELREKAKQGDKTFIDLFCGVGGATLGMMQAGLRHMLGLDLSIDCIVTQKWNLDNELIMASVTHLPLRPLISVDVVWGSPPCVGFSASARAARKNPKTRARHEKINKLVVHFARAILWLSPTAVMFENVPPVKRSLEFREMVEILRHECIPPYNVIWDDLDAADYGVPQHRVRTFLIGIKCDDWVVGVIHNMDDTLYWVDRWIERTKGILKPQRPLDEYFRRLNFESSL